MDHGPWSLQFGQNLSGLLTMIITNCNQQALLTARDKIIDSPFRNELQPTGFLMRRGGRHKIQALIKAFSMESIHGKPSNQLHLISSEIILIVALKGNHLQIEIMMTFLFDGSFNT